MEDDQGPEAIGIDEALTGVGGRGKAKGNSDAWLPKLRSLSASEALLPPAESASPRPHSSSQRIEAVI
jgi:hypothetical protein